MHRFAYFFSFLFFVFSNFNRMTVCIFQKSFTLFVFFNLMKNASHNPCDRFICGAESLALSLRSKDSMKRGNCWKHCVRFFSPWLRLRLRESSPNGAEMLLRLQAGGFHFWMGRQRHCYGQLLGLQIQLGHNARGTSPSQRPQSEQSNRLVIDWW